MDKLTTKHLMFIIWGTTIVSMKTNANIFIRDGGRDSWISMFLASMVILTFLIYILGIYKKNNIYSFSTVYKTALGNVMGTVFLILFVLTLMLVLLEAASVEANAMHTNIFIETPSWYLALFFVIPAIYTVRKGITPIIIITIIGIIFAILAGINLVILTARYKDYKYLLPIMSEGITPGFIKSFLKALGFYGSLAILFPFLSYVKDKTKLKRDAVLGLLFVIQMHVVSITGAITAFGPERSTQLAYPKLTQTQEINYFGFLESGELFVMFQIIGGWFVKYILSFFIILHLLKEINIKNKYIVYLISLIIYLATYYFSNNLFFLTKYLSYYAYICLINFIIIPALVFTIFNIRNKGKKSIKEC
jgi:spore germination protein (amino acid permease)